MSTELSDVLGRARVIDLSYPLTADFPLFPAYDPVRVAQKFSCERDGFFVKSWAFDEHSGTHVDAPAHFGPGAPTVDRIPPEELILSVVVIDVRERVERDHDATVTTDDVLAFEQRHGPLPGRCAVFALTGWGSRVHDPAAYLNADDSGTLHAPGFSEELTEFLKDERPGVRAHRRREQSGLEVALERQPEEQGVRVVRAVPVPMHLRPVRRLAGRAARRGLRGWLDAVRRIVRAFQWTRSGPLHGRWCHIY